MPTDRQAHAPGRSGRAQPQRLARCGQLEAASLSSAMMGEVPDAIGHKQEYDE